MDEIVVTKTEMTRLFDEMIRLEDENKHWKNKVAKIQTTLTKISIEKMVR